MGPAFKALMFAALMLSGCVADGPLAAAPKASDAPDYVKSFGRNVSRSFSDYATLLISPLIGLSIEEAETGALRSGVYVHRPGASAASFADNHPLLANVAKDLSRIKIPKGTRDPVRSISQALFLELLRGLQRPRGHNPPSVHWLDVGGGSGLALLQAKQACNKEGIRVWTSLMDPNHADYLTDDTLLDQLAPEEAALLQAWPDHLKPNVYPFRVEDAPEERWVEKTPNFDLITMVEGIQYVRDKVALIRRLSTWLRPGGMILMRSSLSWPMLIAERAPSQGFANANIAVGHDFTSDLDSSRRGFLSGLGETWFAMQSVGVAHERVDAHYWGFDVVIGAAPLPPVPLRHTGDVSLADLNVPFVQPQGPPMYLSTYEYTGDTP